MAGVFDSGRVALITGGASGIGLAVAHACGRRGMRVVVADFHLGALANARAELEAEFGGSHVFAVECDVTSAASVEAMKTAVYDRFGEVSFLHLNAGVGAGLEGKALQATPEDYSKVFAVNFFGVVHGIRAFVPAMKAQGTPCAVAATSSWAGLFNASSFSGVPYSVSKMAAIALMEQLQAELSREKDCRVTAHVLCPGRVETNMLRGTDEHREPFYAQELAQIADPALREEAQQKMLQDVSKRVAGAMSPEDMAQILIATVEEGGFYVLGWDEQQPLEYLKLLVQLRAEDVIQQRAPLSHRAASGDEQRRRLKKVSASRSRM